MKWGILAAAAVLLLVFGIIALNFESWLFKPTSTDIEENGELDGIKILASGLSIPWEIVFVGEDMLVTERPGTLLRIGSDNTSIEIEGARHTGEGGLLGMVLHPNFEENNWIYLYFTSEVDGMIENRVERYVLDENLLVEKEVIISGIPGASYHDGGRMKFGPDGYLYITTGDAGNEQSAQDTDSLAGKILRLEDNGDIPSDNPLGNAVYSYGHRNPQGLIWDDSGRLWATEHGRSGFRSGFDELNLIEKGGNYGWPVIQGDETRDRMITPVIHSGASDTWAPAGAAFFDGKIYFAGLRGETLYEYDIENDELGANLRGEYGRLRAVVLQGNSLYLSTSNTDGRGTVREDDDKIIRIPLELK